MINRVCKLWARWTFGLLIIGSPLRHWDLYSASEGRVLGKITGWDKETHTFTFKPKKGR